MGMTSMERGLIGLVTLALIVACIWWVGRDRARYRKLILGTLAATFVLIVLGAYVRLSDAGLGCPDWPGCYGNLTPAHSTEAIRAAEAAQPGGPVSVEKAWKEMIHRYLAMILGALIAALMFAAWRNRKSFSQSPGLATGLALLVIFQAALGAWTVTMLLKPAIVTSHLMGGMAIFALLAWLALRQEIPPPQGPAATAGIMRGLAALALLVLIGQIVLGGWVSTNYAALACQDFPMCQGKWMPEMHFEHAFHVIRPLGVGPDGQLLTHEALRAIHWTHRVGALVTALVLGGFAFMLIRRRARKLGAVLLGFLALQIGLGIANVLGSLPLPIAVAHNGVAALLLGWMVLINYRLNVN
jgi:cytochrome c oxidase assembly protein subunit 15